MKLICGVLWLIVGAFFGLPGLLLALGALVADGGDRATIAVTALVCLGIGVPCAARGMVLLKGEWTRRPRRPVDGRRVVTFEMADDDPLYSAIKAIVRRHVHTLTIERRMKLVPDKYGVVEQGSWYAEVESFIDRVALPYLVQMLPERQRRRSYRKMTRRVLRQAPTADRDGILRWVIRGVIEAEVAAHEASSPPRPAARYSTPAEFETWCASVLRECGWDAQVMGGSGDQGVDVRASRDGVVLAVQCKLYSHPVGNTAVQEVFAGKAFYSAHVAAVVASGGFTRGARAVAVQTGVHLLTPDELASFARQGGVSHPPLAPHGRL